jgi:hypothetical protein
MKFKLRAIVCIKAHRHKSFKLPSEAISIHFLSFSTVVVGGRSIKCLCKPQLNGTQYFVTQSTPWNNDSTIFYKIFLCNVAIHH